MTEKRDGEKGGETFSHVDSVAFAFFYESLAKVRKRKTQTFIR